MPPAPQPARPNVPQLPVHPPTPAPPATTPPATTPPATDPNPLDFDAALTAVETVQPALHATCERIRLIGHALLDPVN